MRISVVSSNLYKINEEPKQSNKIRKSPLAIRNSQYYQSETEVKVMDGPSCINNVVIVDRAFLNVPDHLQNLKLHQRLMLKIT
jgi:hypothetical protein